MSRSNKSRRFVQRSVNSIQKHDERIPYHLTMAEAEQRKTQNDHSSSVGGHA